MWTIHKVNMKFDEQQIEKTLAIILRVPGLFLLDYWFQIAPVDAQNIDSPEAITSMIISSFLFLQFLLMLLLPLEDLVVLYMHYISLGLLACMEIFSRHYVTPEYQHNIDIMLPPLFFTSAKFSSITIPFAQIQHHIFAISVHIVVANIVSFLLDIECNMKKTALAVYVVPVAARLANFPVESLETLHNFASIIIILSIIYYCLMSLPQIFYYFHKIYKIFARLMYDRGPLNAAILLWSSSFVMLQLLVFWCASLTLQFYIYYNRKPGSSGDGNYTTPPENVEWYLVLLYAISEVCATPVSLASCCVAVSFTSWSVLNTTKFLARGTADVFNGRHIALAGIDEGVTMALLSLQTGLMELSMPQRAGAMSIILFIVVGSLVQSMHELVEPILLGLSASHVRNISRHARVLCICLFLLIFPLYMTIFLCRLFNFDFWTLVVVSTCALTSVQVVGTLIVYFLFLYDALKKDCGWEALDDTVYYARAITRVLEFLVALLVVGAGVRESLLLSSEGRSWSWMNGIVLAMHCYYNVFQRMQSGWKSFLLRRDAARKIDSLPLANSAQLESRSHDVCAICYAEMKSARVVPCGHLFHGTCLKKWLYVQDRCPLCSAKVTDVKTPETKINSSESTSNSNESPNNISSTETEQNYVSDSQNSGTSSHNTSTEYDDGSNPDVDVPYYDALQV